MRLAHCWMVDQHLDHGGHQQRVRDPVLRDGVQHRLGAEGRNDRVRVALQPVRRGQAHVGQVEHRRGMQVAALGRGQAFGMQGQPRAAHVGVAQHHALGKARGAAGVEDAGQVVVATARVGHGRGGLQQRLVAEHAGRRRAVAAVDHLAQAARLPAHLLDHRAEGVVHQQQRGARVVQRVQDFGRRPADVAGVEHAAAPGHGHLVFEVARRVERQHGDAVALLHAEPLQGARQARDALGIGAKAQGAAGGAHGDPVGVLLHAAVQRLGQVHGGCLRSVLV
ncbi:hypothetical protein D3C87_1056550 [compost metagenome]